MSSRFLITTILALAASVASAFAGTDPVVTAVKRELGERYPGARIEMTGTIRWNRAPQGQAEDIDAMRVHVLATTPQGYAQVAFNGGEGWVSYRAMMPAYVAVRRVLPNEKLSSEMFALQDINVATGQAYDYRGVILPRTQLIDGLEARQTVLEGQFLTSSAVQKVPDIRRGDAVRILVTSGDLTVTTQGIASEPAFVNGRVRVMANKTKREFTGELKDSGTVEVRL